MKTWDFLELRQQQQKLDVERTKLKGRSEGYKGLDDILTEMWDEYNRKHIASRPDWKEFVNEKTGLVDWDLVKSRGADTRRVSEKTIKEQLEKGFVPDIVQKAYDQAGEALGMTLEQFVQETLHILQDSNSHSMPVSPLEMMAAANSGPRKFLQLQRRLNIQRAGEWAERLQLMWALDKVLTPRTGIVV